MFNNDVLIKLPMQIKKEHQVEIMFRHTFTPSPTYNYRYRSELINAENADVWMGVPWTNHKDANQ